MLILHELPATGRHIKLLYDPFVFSCLVTSQENASCTAKWQGSPPCCLRRSIIWSVAGQPQSRTNYANKKSLSRSPVREMVQKYVHPNVAPRYYVVLWAMLF